MLRTALTAISASSFTWFFLEQQDQLQSLVPQQTQEQLQRFMPTTKQPRRRGAARRHLALFCRRPVPSLAALLQDVAADTADSLGAAAASMADRIWGRPKDSQSSDWTALFAPVLSAAAARLAWAKDAVVARVTQACSKLHPNHRQSLEKAALAARGAVLMPVEVVRPHLEAIKTGFLERHPEHAASLGGRDPVLLLFALIALLYFTLWELRVCSQAALSIVKGVVATASRVSSCPRPCSCCRRRGGFSDAPVESKLSQEPPLSPPQTLGSSSSPPPTATETSAPSRVEGATAAFTNADPSLQLTTCPEMGEGTPSKGTVPGTQRSLSVSSQPTISTVSSRCSDTAEAGVEGEEPADAGTPAKKGHRERARGGRKRSGRGQGGQ
mmetsp:Transcript_6438/g.17381  ORF Transcript_6438/g.17381 Transcript_6438/m.17381 type:complete len:384 (-) Transcript_6438:88-1239(-)